ncbi:hypothetical protein Q3G72_006227 [Acer saccharum]|nr:hypothetical protein Q3G72_006227 [Acer saccharum]
MTIGVLRNEGRKGNLQGLLDRVLAVIMDTAMQLCYISKGLVTATLNKYKSIIITFWVKDSATASSVHYGTCRCWILVVYTCTLWMTSVGFLLALPPLLLTKKHLIIICLSCASCYGQRPEEEKNFSERPCCHSHHHRTATIAAAFERPIVASAAEEPIRTGSDDRAAFVASTITPFLVELNLTDGDTTIVSVGRFAAKIG